MRKLSLLLLPLLLTFHCAAASFVADFNSGAADPRLFVSQPLFPVCKASPCETVSYGGYNAQFSFTGASDPYNNTNILLHTGFGLVGNYTVTVDVVTENLPNTLADLYTAAWLQVGGTALEWATYPNVIGDYVDSLSLSGPMDETALPRHLTGSPTPVTFKIQRVVSGSTATIYFYYDLGDGDELLWSHSGASAGITGPVVIGLDGYGAIDASVTFDNLTITADHFTPEPATWSFGLAAGLIGLALRWRACKRRVAR